MQKLLNRLSKLNRTFIAGVLFGTICPSLIIYDSYFIPEGASLINYLQRFGFGASIFLVAIIPKFSEGVKQTIQLYIFFIYCTVNLITLDATYLFSYIQIFPPLLAFFPATSIKNRIIFLIMTYIVPILLMPLVNEPIFVKAGHSVKIPFALIYLCTLTVLYVYVYVYHFRFEAQQLTSQKFIQIGERLQYLFHELKGASSRIIHKANRDESLKSLETDSKYILALLKLIQIKDQGRRVWEDSYSLSSIITDALHSIQKEAHYFKITINNTLEDAQILTDRDLLFLAIKNIIQNAIKYTADHDVKKEITISGQQKKNNYHLSISNYVDHQFQISDLKRSIDHNNKKGLGLIITKEISSLLHLDFSQEISQNELISKFFIVIDKSSEMKIFAKDCDKKYPDHYHS